MQAEAVQLLPQAWVPELSVLGTGGPGSDRLPAGFGPYMHYTDSGVGQGGSASYLCLKSKKRDSDNTRFIIIAEYKVTSMNMAS